MIKHNTNCIVLKNNILRLLINKIYDIRNVITNYNNFDLLRKNYKNRNEWSVISIMSNNMDIIKKIFRYWF
ncbi:MAG: DUF3410 domain-containing protein [Candidatus Lightella neohaematopini]|nr:DUF3410 domain-containing protein [Candidatus Lightella neohaematopini]